MTHGTMAQPAAVQPAATRRGAARRLASIEESATYAVLDMVRRMRAEGADVLDLGGGEPDFDSPAHVTAEAVAALGEGFTHYTQSRGLPELLEAVARKLAVDNGIAVDPRTGVIATPSAKHALFVALTTVLDPGDEVLILTPSWVSYPAMAQLIGARPVFAELGAHNGFRIDRALLDAHLTERTRAILVNTPNNPTGRALTRPEAEALAGFAAENDLVIVSDEIYEKIRYVPGTHLSPAAMPGCAERTLTVNGFSKGYAMTGWRLGYLAGPPDLIGEALKVQQHTVGCAGSFVQRGGVAALTGPQEPVHEMTAQYAARRDLLVSGLNALAGISCEAPDGGLYVFPDIRGLGFPDGAAAAKWLLQEAAVAVTPGSAFGPGGEGHIRLSFATSSETLADALERIGRAVSRR